MELFNLSNFTVSQVTKSVNEQLAKEEGYVLQAAKKMKELQVKMKDDQEVYTNELNAYKDKIDKEFFEKEKVQQSFLILHDQFNNASNRN